MKRLVNILIVLSLSYSLFGQPLDGSGTKADPYSGTFEDDLQWNITNFSNGKVFIGGDVTIDDEKLTIGAGMKILFVAEGADLIVTSTGQIDATGSSGSEIVFTADDDDDGTYGETGERWGHIVFQAMDGVAGSSVFEYCEISFGDVRSGSNTSSYGGGLYISNFDEISFKYCSLHDNKGTHGGAVMLWSGSSPSFDNCKFLNNSANTSGGGFYSHSNSTSTFKNCLFYSNSTGTGGGGAFFLDGSSNIVVDNCLIVQNTSTSTTRGENVHLNGVPSTTRPSFTNCIIWGDDNSIGYFNSTPDESDFNYCAIEDTQTPASSFTNCIDLNSSNSASDGPNFTVTDGTDWSILFISPCRDTGTDSGAPTSDYDDNGRIGTTDIGAYEVQYSRWDGSTSSTWGTATNWEQDVLPTSGLSDVIIPYVTTDFPDHTGTYTIGNGKYLIIEPRAQATFETLVNSTGILELKSDANGIFSLLFDTYTDSSGEERIEMYFTGGGSPNYKWHYIAVPDNAVDIDPFTVDISNYNLLSWDESKIVDDKMQGWQWWDGFGLTTPFSEMNTKKGYNFYFPRDTTLIIPSVTGMLSSMGPNVSLDYNSDGLNLIGNSMTSSIDWDEVTTSGSVADAIYFTKDNSIASYVTGLGTGGATSVIPPLQGFFVKALATGSSLDFTGEMVKLHDNTINRYKSGQSMSYLRLGIKQEEQIIDETIVRFNELATTDFDNSFDASKLFVSASSKSLVYTSLGEEIYSINGVAYPDPEEEIIIPVSVKIVGGGNYTFSRMELKGLEDYNVKLIDTYQSDSTDLQSEDAYSFSSAEGTFDDRFQLKISDKTPLLDEVINADKLINIYAFNNNLYIRPNNDNWSDPETDIKVYDLMGRVVSSISNIGIYGGETKEIAFNHPNGIYIVELSGNKGRIVQKVSKR